MRLHKMVGIRALLAPAGVMILALQAARAQAPASDVEAQLKEALQQIEHLANQVAAQDARIRQLEGEHGAPTADKPSGELTAAIAQGSSQPAPEPVG
jgi:hypothetical protein